MKIIRFSFNDNRLRSTSESGFTYLGLLIIVAIMSITALATVQMGTFLQRKMAEEELLQIGMEFRNAFISYAAATPKGQSRYPETLQDLLKDPRYPNTRRYLRKIYADPITGKEEWDLIKALDGRGIAGVSSLSNEHPIKVGNFDLVFQQFSGTSSYRQWRFSSDDEWNAANGRSGKR